VPTKRCFFSVVVEIERARYKRGVVSQWLWEEYPLLVSLLNCVEELQVLKMKLSSIYGTIVAAASLASATIWQNDQVRITDYPDTVIDPSGYQLNSYPPNATELSYKGRWDSKFISWYS
jgi:hypothetical protein